MNEVFVETLRLKLTVLGLYLPRITIAAMFLPAFASKMMPGMVRNCICISALIGIVAFTEDSPLPSELTASYMMGFAIREGMIGVAIGLAFSIVLSTGEIIGQLIDQQTGLTFTQNLDPVNGQSVSVTAALLHKLWSVVFVAAGGFLLFFETITTSYLLWPIDKWFPDLPRLLSMMLLREVAIGCARLACFVRNRYWSGISRKSCTTAEPIHAWSDW
jgi:type III secretion protein T